MVKLGDQQRLMLLDLLALGNVTYDASEHSPPGHHHFTDCKLHWKNRTVLAPSGYLAAMSDHLGLACSQIIADVVIVFAVVRFRHQHFDIAPNNLARAIAEDARCCRIDVLDHALGVDGYDGVLDCVEDSGHHRRVLAPLCEGRSKQECAECNADNACLGSPNAGLRRGTNFAKMPNLEGDRTNDQKRNDEYCGRREGEPTPCRKPQQQWE